ncbi:hypothetical protein ACT80S_07265 [Ramlibacter sp. MAHUQ-53]|uniref:hypothetical protein n=1 Tax=unclassified Ramlibacter TaxID=2617605 RepID=UPI003630E1DB
MSHAHRPHDARGQFARLIAALGRRIGQPLLPDEGSVALADARDALQLMVELSTEEDCIHAIRPFIEIPDDEADAGRLACELLRVNADRDALGRSLVCAYTPGRLYCLVQRLELDLSPAAFVMAIEELAELGDALRASLLGRGDPVPRPANLQLHRA